MIGRSKDLYKVFVPVILLIFAIPVLAFYPLLVQIIGLNDIPILLIALTFAISMVIINTANGLQAIPATYHKVGTSLKLTRTERFRNITLPAASTNIFAGLKLSFIYATLATIGSGYILAISGLGYLIRTLMRTTRLQECSTSSSSSRWW